MLSPALMAYDDSGVADLERRAHSDSCQPQAATCLLDFNSAGYSISCDCLLRSVHLESRVPNARQSLGVGLGQTIVTYMHSAVSNQSDMAEYYLSLFSLSAHSASSSVRSDHMAMSSLTCQLECHFGDVA